jgi:hypothetical protein
MGHEPRRDGAPAGSRGQPRGSHVAQSWLWLQPALRRGGQADKHIDHAQNIIRVEQSKGRRDRNVMLSAETLDLLQQWWKARVMMPERRWRNAGITAVPHTWGSARIPMCT